MKQRFAQFHKKIFRWYKKYGRHDLPWQKKLLPYRVWISEIMLQQTQVQTVIPYFERFLKSFPTIETLANAPVDKVMQHWSGLGYYSRARNLHRTAQIIVHEFNNHWPQNMEELQQLPGIGRSTAGAILSFSMKKRAVILDGNVQRVLLRFHAIKSWLGNPFTLQELWKKAEELTPQKHFQEYNQAMMDLGAMICTRTQPKCNECPLQKDCQAFQKNLTASIPMRKPKKTIPIKKIIWLILENENGEVLLEKRGAVGIWSGLWSFPQCSAAEDWKTFFEKNYHDQMETFKKLKAFQHVFSHQIWHITPIKIKSQPNRFAVFEQKTIWHHPSKPFPHGLPTPVKKLLEKLLS